MLGQLLRYLIVGGLGFLVAVACYAAATTLGVPPYPAVVVVFVLNGIFNFTFFRLWAFPGGELAVRTQARRFVVVALLALAVNYATFAVLYSLAGLPAVLAQTLAIVTATPVSFLANRTWSFGPSAAV